MIINDPPTHDQLILQIGDTTYYLNPLRTDSMPYKDMTRYERNRVRVFLNELIAQLDDLVPGNPHLMQKDNETQLLKEELALLKARAHCAECPQRSKP